MTPKRFKDTLRDLDQDISNCQLNLKHCSDEKTRKSYEDLLKIYQNDKDEFVKKHSFVLAMATLLIIFIIMSFLT